MTALVERDETRATYPLDPQSVPTGQLRIGRYVVRFATSRSELAAVQRLRFEVFNRELDEGLSESWAAGADEDRFDRGCHHLAVWHTDGGIVGTYRLMTRALAEHTGGFYTETEFDLEPLPEALLANAVEIGRACVHRDHRNGRVIMLLWRGLARYLRWNAKRWLFGCCSVPTLDSATAWRLYRELESAGRLHATMRVEPLPALRCESGHAGGAPQRLPRLFESYLTLGARVCGGPALDRAFKVTDFMVLLDSEELTPAQREMFDRGQWTDGASVPAPTRAERDAATRLPLPSRPGSLAAEVHHASRATAHPDRRSARASRVLRT